MGKKYIIELENEPFTGAYFEAMPDGSIQREVLYRVKGFKSLVFDEEGLKRLTPYKEPQYKEPFDFSERLNEALGRFWKGSNRSFAEACGVTEVSMSRYLSGNRVPKAPLIITMAKVLGVSADYLLGLEDE